MINLELSTFNLQPFYYGNHLVRPRLFCLHGPPALAVVTDPFGSNLGLTPPRLRANVVTVSHDAPGHNNVAAAKGYDHVFNGPGEYEVNGVFITGVPTYHKGRVGERERNTAFVFEFEDLTVCHLGDMGELPGREQVEELSGADVLLLPVGGGISSTPPKPWKSLRNWILASLCPWDYAQPGLKLELDSVDKFLKEMGVPAPDPLSSLKLRKSDLSRRRDASRTLGTARSE